MPAAVDLRSDTMTRPSQAMREAMAAAEVGDDVWGEDPTVAALQARCAELAGKEAALFVPSGTMANLIACRMHTVPGDEVIIERGSHLYRYEAGGYAAVAGCSVALLDGERGLLDPGQLQGALRAADLHQPRSRLLWLEHTHNFGGGTYYTLPALRELREAAAPAGLRVHLDGARVWNACVAGGQSLAEVAACCDSLSCCFSKGLGCPVGSVLIGGADDIERARRIRKQLGGGMRQVGVLAAAALYALEHHVPRLADDHARAGRLAAALATLPDISVGEPPTNMVFAEAGAWPGGAAALAATLEELGLRGAQVDASRLRFVLHLDIDSDAFDAACARIAAHPPRAGRG